MIISHSRKFIFVKTYKTAGSSLEVALSKYCAKDDILTPLDGDEETKRRELSGGLGARNYGKAAGRYRLEDLAYLASRRKIVERYNEHSAAWQIRRMVGEEIWGSYFKFTIVRNPYDRCLSRFYYSKKVLEDRGKGRPWDLEDLDQYMRYNPWFINENWVMYTQSDRPIVDFFVRYEHLEADLGAVSERLGLGHNLHDDLKSISAKRGIRPKSSAPSVRLSPAGRDMVTLLCAPEIALFGYAPDGFAEEGEAASAEKRAS